MKKIAVLMILVVFLGGFGFAQTPDLLDIGALQGAFGEFSEGVANALPMASTVGLQWSDAYIGKLPHLGVGTSFGFATIPLGFIEPVLGVIDLDLWDLVPPEAAPYFEAGYVGLPFPALVLDARLGGILLPFDIGVKYGWIPEEINSEIESSLEGLEIDYELFGADIRFALATEPKGFSLIPDLSVGAGYNYYRGYMALPMGEGFRIDDIEIPAFDKSGVDFYNYDIEMSAPKVGFNWESHVIDVKAQLSKTLLWLFRPYVGVGASYGRSRAGGGLYSEMMVWKDGIPSDFEELREDIEAAKEEAPEGFEFDVPMDEQQAGFLINRWVDGWGFRAFAGLGVQLFFLKVDLAVMYDILGQSFGAQVGARLQFGDTDEKKEDD